MIYIGENVSVVIFLSIIFIRDMSYDKSLHHAVYPVNAEPMLIQCWPTDSGARPTLNQAWVNVSCLLGSAIF